MTTKERQRLVVGVDGSEDSNQALRWALEHAPPMGAEVEALTAWEVPLSILLVPTATERDYEDRAERVLQAVMDEVVGPAPAVTVTARLVEGRPANVLTSEARGAALLVVGGHGRGELPGMHLGSVAGYCVHHAPCPVVVVRDASE